jgi:catechol 2,3-dioxygenase-like lactoylglutathione lyase family enzyme
METAASPALTGLVPMIRVADMDRSITFYRRLGFEIGNFQPRSGPLHWAWLYTPGASDWRRAPNLMIVRGEEEVPGEEPMVLFYLYASDLVRLRSTLLEAGVEAGPIDYPEYLPDGEFCLQDPDGYRLMVAQSAADTP